MVINKFKSNFRAAMTLIETSIVLIIITAAMAAGANIYSQHLENRTNQIAAQELTKVSNAFGRYLKDNYGLMMQQSINDPSGSGVTEVGIDKLTQGGYLYETFENRNPFAQEYRLMVKFIAASGPGENDKLESVVYTSGGEVIKPSAANNIAQLVGAGGGFTMPDGDTSEVKSTFGGFSLDLSTTYSRDPGPGKLVSAMFFDDEGSLVSDFLYRNEIPGRPDLNQMNTHIDMTGHDLNAVRDLNADDVNVANKVTSSDVDVSNQLAVGGTAFGGHSLSVNGTSQLQGEVGIGGGTVSGQALNVTGNTRLDGNQLVTGSSTLQGPVGIGGATASGYALNVTGNTRSGGNIAATGAVSAGTNVTASGAITAAGQVQGSTLRSTGGANIAGQVNAATLSTTGAIYSANQITTPGAVQGGSLRSTGAARVDGRLTANEYVHLNRVATENAACSPNGLLGRNNTGAALSCESGKWKKIGGSDRLIDMAPCTKTSPLITTNGSRPNFPYAFVSLASGKTLSTGFDTWLCLAGAWQHQFYDSGGDNGN